MGGQIICRGKRVVKKSILYFIGNLSSKIMSTLILPIYAFYIQADTLGYFDYAQTIKGIIIPLVYIAIWEAILRFLLHEPDKFKQRTIITTSASFTIFMTILFIVGIVIYKVFFKPEINSLLLITIMYLTYAISQIWQYFARAMEENKLYIISGILGTIFNFLSLVFLVIIFRLELNGLLISYIFGQLSIFAIIEKKMRIIRNIRVKYFDYDTLKKMLNFSSPLVLNLISAWLISGLGRMLITNKLGTEMNGLFTFATKFSLIVTTIGSVVTMAIIEETIIAAKMKNFGSEFTKTIEFLFKVFLTLSIIALPAIALFYSFIKNTSYYASSYYYPWMLLYAVFSTMSSNIGSAFQALNITKYQFITTVIGAVITILISSLLISSINVYAVIFGQVFGVLGMLISRYILINKFIVFKVNWRPIIAMVIIFIFVSLMVMMRLLYMNIILLVLLTLISCYLYKEYLIKFKKVAMQKIGNITNLL